MSEALRLRNERTGAAGRQESRSLVLLDLALPRDVETAAGRLPGVRLIDLGAIGAASGRPCWGAGGCRPRGLWWGPKTPPPTPVLSISARRASASARRIASGLS